MILIESIIGNEGDAPWPERLQRAEVDYLQLDQWQAQKNRFRKTTAKGTELAVSLDRNSHLRDGDILFWDDAGTAIVARISLQDVMIIQLRGLFDRPPEVLAKSASNWDTRSVISTGPRWSRGETSMSP